MPVVRGTVAGRIHNPVRCKARVVPSCRGWLKFDEWERQLVIRWMRDGLGVEEVARRLMRPVAQIVRFDPVRPNGRRQ